MKKLTYLAYPLVALMSVAAAGAAFADDITVDNTASVPSLKSRDQVRSELLQARADGSIKAWSTSYNPLLLAKSVNARADVKAARDTAYASTFYGEDSGSFALSRQKPAHVAGAVYAAT